MGVSDSGPADQRTSKLHLSAAESSKGPPPALALTGYVYVHLVVAPLFLIDAASLVVTQGPGHRVPISFNDLQKPLSFLPIEAALTAPLDAKASRLLQQRLGATKACEVLSCTGLELEHSSSPAERDMLGQHELREFEAWQYSSADALDLAPSRRLVTGQARALKTQLNARSVLFRARLHL